MNKLLESIRKNYKAVNITILCLCIYLLFIFPIVSTILEKISPVLTRCPYLQLTGKPCPLCGGTRFLKNIKTVFHDITYVFNFFGLVILILIMETIFRIINIKTKQNKKKVIIYDVLVHIILFISYLIYVVNFIKND